MVKLDLSKYKLEPELRKLVEKWLNESETPEEFCIKICETMSKLRGLSTIDDFLWPNWHSREFCECDECLRYWEQEYPMYYYK